MLIEGGRARRVFLAREGHMGLIEENLLLELSVESREDECLFLVEVVGDELRGIEPSVNFLFRFSLISKVDAEFENAFVGDAVAGDVNHGLGRRYEFIFFLTRIELLFLFLFLLRDWFFFRDSFSKWSNFTGEMFSICVGSVGMDLKRGSPQKNAIPKSAPEPLQENKLEDDDKVPSNPLTNKNGSK